jgi:ABC-2 type transport system permease protein
MGRFRAELRKLTTVRTTAVLTLLGWGLVALSGLLIVLAGIDEATGAPVMGLAGGGFSGTQQEVADLVDQVGGSAILVLVVGLLVVTTEFRHATIGRTLQLTPSRVHVLALKLAAGLAYAIAFFVGGLLVVGGLLALGAVTQGVRPSIGPAVATALWHGAVGLGLTALLGVAVGALVRNQVVAVTVSLVWVFLVENLVAQLAPAVARWLPFQAQQAIFVSQEMRERLPDGVLDLLDPAVGLAVFLAYVLLAAGAAAALMRARDV